MILDCPGFAVNQNPGEQDPLLRTPSATERHKVVGPASYG